MRPVLTALHSPAIIVDVSPMPRLFGAEPRPIGRTLAKQLAMALVWRVNLSMMLIVSATVTGRRYVR